MATLIKNQIIKHLSKFVKNLSQNQIHLSTFKGEGDLTNLELDEKVLADVLDLPTWLVLSKAVCNKVSVKIPWTKLKTHPICVYLDHVEVIMATGEEPDQSRKGQFFKELSGEKYGFSDRVVDGMYVSVNSVSISFQSFAFHASIQISRLQTYGTTPGWKWADLRLTRIQDQFRGMVMIFREVNWSNLRVEVDAIKKDPQQLTTPIRLITNLGRIHLTIKKKLIDCSVVSAKLEMILDDLLWVLTDSQLKAVIGYMQSLADLITKSADLSKIKEGTNQSQQYFGINNVPLVKQGKLSKDAIMAARYFDKYDFVETSYHLSTKQVDLHFCDETHRQEHETFRRRTEGGAMQITLSHFSLNFYPYHVDGSSCRHWKNYDNIMKSQEEWLGQLMADYEQKKRAGTNPPAETESPKKKSLTEVISHQKLQPGQEVAGGKGQQRPGRRPRSAKRMFNSLTVRLEDFTVYAVSTSSSSHKAPSKKFISSNKRALYLPAEMAAVHFQYTSYYYPDDLKQDVPPDNLYVQINPIQINLDYTTILWSNLFTNNAIQQLKKDDAGNLDAKHIDIKIDALMPQVILNAEEEVKGQPDRPNALQIQASEIVVTNSRVGDKTPSQADLSTSLQQLQEGRLFSRHGCYPSQEGDLAALPAHFWEYAYGGEDPAAGPAQGPPHSDNAGGGADSAQEGGSLSRDIWCLKCHQLWVEFLGIKQARGRPVSLLESVPLTLWMSPAAAAHPASRPPSVAREKQQHGHPHPRLLDYYKSKLLDGTPGESAVEGGWSGVAGGGERPPDWAVLCQARDRLRLMVDHHQLLFLLRLQDSLVKLSVQLEDDMVMLTGRPSPAFSRTVAFGCGWVQLSLVLPPLDEPEPEPESSSGSTSSLSVAGPAGSGGESQQTIGGESQQTAATANGELRLTSQGILVTEEYLLEVVREGNGGPHIREGSPGPRAAEAGAALQQQAGLASLAEEAAVHASTSQDSLASAQLGGLVGLRDSQHSLPASLRGSLQSLDALSGLPYDDLESMGSDCSDGFTTLSLEELGGGGPGEMPGSDYRLPPLVAGQPSDPAGRERPPAAKENQMSGSETGSSLGSNSSDQPTLRNKKVSVVDLEVAGLQLGLQLDGAESVLRLTAERAEVEQRGNLIWEQFVSRRALGSNKGSQQLVDGDDLSTSQNSQEPLLSLRMESGPKVKEHFPDLANTASYLSLKVHGYKNELLVSTINNFVAMIGDEVSGEPLPMDIEIRDACVAIKSDTPPVFPGLAPAAPVVVQVPGVHVKRTPDGTFHVQVLKSEELSKEEKGAAGIGATLSSAKTVVSFEKAAKMAEDNQVLREQLHLQKKCVQKMELERSSLMATLHNLQEELLSIEKERSKLKESLKRLNHKA